jgi:predicted histone-like DNA-binding protein
MKYKIIKRYNPLKRTEGKWYAAPISDGRITQMELSREISALSSLSRGDVSNVVENMLDIIPKYLLMGKSISLGELGTLRILFSSEGVENPEEFTVALIKGLKVFFTPGRELKKALQDIRYEKEGK